MRVLLLKTSSMGDVIHTLPALSDAQQAFPDIQFDWVVEEAFADIPRWHPAVKQVIPVALRRWRKSLWNAQTRAEIRQFRQTLAAQPYDLVIDAQGLLKSAILTRGLQAPIAGFDKRSAREPIASCFYQQRFFVDKNQHAVERTRALFAQALNYAKPQAIGAYALDKAAIAQAAKHALIAPYLIFLHGTTWPSKHWPEENWRALAQYYNAQKQTVYLPFGNAQEQARAERIAQDLAFVHVLPKVGITELAAYLQGARACVAVDTGLGHLAAALAVPCISLYGPTSPAKVGAYGAHQIHLCSTDSNAASGDRKAFCFASVDSEKVITVLDELLDENKVTH